MRESVYGSEIQIEPLPVIWLALYTGLCMVLGAALMLAWLGSRDL